MSQECYQVDELYLMGFQLHLNYLLADQSKMQGNLREFNIRSILQFIELEQYTGTLYIENEKFYCPGSLKSTLISLPKEKRNLSLENSNNYQIWLLYFTDGKITYATDQNYDNLSRIHDYLNYFQLEKHFNCLQEKSVNITSPQEYNAIWFLMQKQSISLQQAQIIIKNLIKETLWEVSNLTQGQFVFQRDYSFVSQWHEIKTSVVIQEILGQLQLWKQFSPYIKSPHQYLVLSEKKKLCDSVSLKTYKTLSIWAQEKLSLLRLSRQLNYPFVYLAKALYPCVKKGWIKLVDDNKQLTQKFVYTSRIAKPHIVCMDDEMTIGKNVEYILKQRGYDSTIITDPIQALTTIFQVKPDLIICDLDMPQLDGYELCNMLRNSRMLRSIPLIVMSEQEDCLTRLRARILSSTNYLSKPFTRNELMILVERCLNMVKTVNSIGLRQSLIETNMVKH